jgi:hypothetical protein
MSDTPDGNSFSPRGIATVCILAALGAIACALLFSGSSEPLAKSSSRESLPIVTARSISPVPSVVADRSVPDHAPAPETIRAPSIPTVASDSLTGHPLQTQVSGAAAGPATSSFRPPPDEPAAPGTAKMTVAGKVVALPNHSSHYERAQIERGQRVHIDLSYLGDDAYPDVFAHAIQGGTINGKTAQRFDLTSSKTVSFDFVPASEAGLYEVLLRRGVHEEVLQFWVPTRESQHDPSMPVLR